MPTVPTVAYLQAISPLTTDYARKTLREIAVAKSIHVPGEMQRVIPSQASYARNFFLALRGVRNV